MVIRDDRLVHIFLMTKPCFYVFSHVLYKMEIISLNFSSLYQQVACGINTWVGNPVPPLPITVLLFKGSREVAVSLCRRSWVQNELMEMAMYRKESCHCWSGLMFSMSQQDTIPSQYMAYVDQSISTPGSNPEKSQRFFLPSAFQMSWLCLVELSVQALEEMFHPVKAALQHRGALQWSMFSSVFHSAKYILFPRVSITWAIF